MQAVQFLILGVIAVLVGVVLIGPVTTTVATTTSQGVCATGGTPTALVSGTLSATRADDLPVPYRVRAGSTIYEPGYTCADDQTDLTAIGAITETSGARTLTAGLAYSIAGTTGGQVAGPLGYGFMSSRALAILIPLIFVACILVIPIYVCWEKMKNGSGGM